MSRARDLSRLTSPTNFTPDGTTGRVGLGSENPTAKLNVAGIVSATAFYGDGSNLEGVASAGLGTAVDDTSEFGGQQIYFTDTVLGIAGTVTVNPPDSSNIAYTQYQEISVDTGADLIIGDGDDLITDILGISSDVQVPGILAGGGGRVRADNFSDKVGTGAPTFPTGINVSGAATVSGNLTVGGVLTYADVTNIDVIGIITARSNVSIADSIIHTGDTDTSIRFPAAGTFTINTDGSEALRVDSSQRLLVGNTSPRSNAPGADVGFQIEGASGGPTNKRFTQHIFGSGDGSGPYLGLAKHRGTSVGGNTIVVDDDELGGIYFQGADGTNFKQGASILGFVDGTPGSNDMPGRLSFQTTADGASSPTERLRITSDGKLFIDRTHASATTGNHPALDIDTYANGTAGATFATGIDFRIAGVHKKRLAITNADANVGTGDWVFYRDNGANEALRITSDGKVGIGEDSPDGLLVIKGDSNGASNPSIRLKDGTDTREAWITNASGDLILANGGDDNTPHCKITMFDANIFSLETANTEKLRIDSSGRMLLGTSSSLGDQLLQVSGSTDGAADLFVANSGASTGNTCALTLGPANNIAGSRLLCTAEEDFSTGANRTARLEFHTRSNGTLAERMRIDPTGRLFLYNITGNASSGSTLKYSASDDEVRYDTSSRLLKTNITECTYGIETIKKLKPSRYTPQEYDTDGNINVTDEILIGFIADEMVEEVPEVVQMYPKSTLTKNVEDTEIVPAAISYDKLTAVLTKALQEAIAKIETLEAAVAALQG